MSKPTAEEISRMTPMMRQYFEIKERAQEGVLFFRMGDFYEIFGDEAEEVAPKLNITLTSRERGDKNRMPFCGVPHHSAQAYWLKLLKMGYKIAIADQVEDASLAKGLVKRDIIKIMSPGCIDELEGLTSDEANYVLAVYEVPKLKKWCLAVADISTGELRLGEAKNIGQIVTFVELFKPKELLCRRFCMESLQKALASYQTQNPLLFSALPEGILRDEQAQKELVSKVFQSNELKDQLCGHIEGGRALISALFEHFTQMQASIGQFLNIRALYDKDCLNLNETLIRDLEIFETSRLRKSEGSLFRQINYCLSPMGSRALRWSLAHPFAKKKAIIERQEAVSSVLNAGEGFLIKIRSNLKGLGDVERLSTRLLAKNIRPNELSRIRDSLKIARDISRELSSKANINEDVLFCGALKNLESAEQVLDILSKALIENPLNLGEGKNVFSKGFDTKLDEFLSYSQDGQKKVEDYADKLKSESGISSLKIKPHKTFGLLIEVTKSNLSRVPKHFIRRQTMVNCERFMTSELKDLDESLGSAKEQAIAREHELYSKLIESLARFQENLRQVSSALGIVDLIQGFSWLALKYDYTRSKLVSDKSSLKMKACRHPVVEHFVGRHKFIANDIELSSSQKQMLITGPNMAGKSTVMRQVAICALLNQVGSFIPAQEANMPIFDGIYTRVGAGDDLSRGLSTFMVEMSEAAYIIRNASSRSLVILDEVGRGTSTEDGLAIAHAILKHLSSQLKCWTLFSTHYHELVELSSQLKGLKICQTEVIENNDNIEFTHRLIEGASGNSYGLEVAKLAGVPSAVVDNAKDFLAQTKSAENPKKNKQQESTNAITNQGGDLIELERPLIFSSDDGVKNQNQAFESEFPLQELSEKIEKIKINRTTPLQALTLLSDIKSLIQQSSHRNLFHDRQNLT